jgi:RHS repeat-associated protein
LKTCTGHYRYGFNGKEKDEETYCDGNAYDFAARIYDERFGRWMSVDPLTSKKPNWTP